jgi:hypothetical protein
MDYRSPQKKGSNRSEWRLWVNFDGFHLLKAGRPSRIDQFSARHSTFNRKNWRVRILATTSVLLIRGMDRAKPSHRMGLSANFLTANERLPKVV